MSDENDDVVVEPPLRKIPPMDDEAGQIDAVMGALASALLTASDTPIHSLPSVLHPVAERLVDYGIRQTDLVSPDATFAPSWVTEGHKQHAMPVPEQVDHFDAPPPVARTATAPPAPKRISAAARAQQE